MRWDETELGRPRIVLSRRNLLTLLAKLDGHPPDSACTIGGHDGGRDYEVKAETDEVHYSGRPAPGPMIEATEEYLATLRPRRKDIIADVPAV